MSTVSHFNIKVAVDAKTGEAQIVKFGKTGKESVEKVGKAAKDASGSFLSFSNLIKGAGAAALGMFAAKAVQGAAELENYGVQFEVLTGSAEKGAKLFQDIRDFGAVTPFNVNDLAQSANKMLANNMAIETIMPTMDMLSNVAAGSAQKLDTLTTAFSRVTSNGKLQGEELNMMIDTGFNPLVIIAEKTGKSMAVLRKEMEQGKIGSEQIADAFKTATSEGGKFYQMNEKMSMTFSGMLSTLQDTVGALVAEAGQPFLMLLKELMPVITPIIQGLKDFLMPLFNELAKTIKAALPPFMALLDNVFKALAPIMQVVTSSMGKLSPIFNKLIIAAGKLVEAAMPMIDMFASLVEDQLDQLVPLLDALLDLFIALSPAIILASKVTADIIKMGLSFMNTVVTPLVNGIKDIIKYGAQAANWVAKIFGGGKKAPKQKKEEQEEGGGGGMPIDNPLGLPTTTATEGGVDSKEIIRRMELAAKLEAIAKELNETTLQDFRDSIKAQDDAYKDFVNRMKANLDSLGAHQGAKRQKEIDAERDEQDTRDRIALIQAEMIDDEIQREMALYRIRELLLAESIKDEEEYQAARAQLEKETNQAIMSIRMQQMDELAGIITSALSSLGELFNANFEEMKYISIAEAIINTAQGVTKALAQGGWLGIAGAVSVGLAGAAQIKKIINTRPGSGASGSGPAPVQSGSAPSGQRLAPQRLNISGASQKIELSGTLVAKGGDLVYVMNEQTRMGERTAV